MGITDYYDIPYPELTDEPDGAAQMKAIADRIEALLKNGFQIPTGDLTIGDTATAAQRLLLFGTKVGTDEYTMGVALHGVGYGFLVLKKNNVEINRFIVGIDGSFQALASGIQRPFPFATYAGNYAVTVTAAVTGVLGIVFPAGRFTVTPTVQVTTNGGSPAYSFATNANAITATGCNILVRNLDNAATSATVNCSVFAIQMTPTSAAG